MERGLSPIVFPNIANKDIDEARKDEGRGFFMGLTRTGISGYDRIIVRSLLLQVKPLFEKTIGRKEAIL